MLLTSMPMGDAAITALLGYGVVFFGLILLMIVVIVIGKSFSSAAKEPKKAETPAAIPTPVPVSAPGSAGGVKLYNVDPKTAAMLMAIVADKLQKPLNELRFISIKEVEQ
ncbi:MAG: OadG family protein [Oscillospiraceae bacterium]|nr:OadG family protein [Oscillospiraceae bacterium]